MKNRLLAAVALCAATSSTMPLWAAVNVDKPEVSSTVELDEVNGGSYYIYNLGAKMFLTAGNAYGTQTSLGETGYVIKVKHATDAASSLSGWTFEYPKDAPGNNGGKPKYMYIAPGGVASYVDYNLSGSYLWKIQKTESGSYRISIIDEAPEHGSIATGYQSYAGQMNSDLSAEGIDNTVVQPMINYDSYDVEAQKKALIDWAFVTPEVYEVYAAKQALYEVFERADETGFTETASFEAIYNKENVTVAELEQAVADLNDAIDEYVYNQASEENPIDLTSKIQNADFGGTSSYNAGGWTLNGMGSGPNSHPVEGSDRVLSAYCEAWTASNGGSGALSDKSALQTVKGLPGGKYKLYVDMIAVQQGEPTRETSGAFLVADGGFGEVRTEHKTTESDGIGRTVELDFNVLEGADVVIGVRTISANFNWFAVDNFRLEFVGVLSAMDMAKSQLDAKISECEEYYDMEINQNGKVCSTKGQEAFQNLIQLAKDSYAAEGIEADSLVSLCNMLQVQKDEFAYDLSIYDGETAVFTNKMAGFESLIYDNPSYPSDEEFIFAETEAFITATNEAFGNLEFDPKEFNGLDAVVDSLYRKDISNALVAGTTTNATGLIVNPNFDNDSSNGWTGGPSVGWNVAEAYDKTFDIYQTLKNLPAGSYKITANGAYRPGSNDVCMAVGPDDPANRIASYIYGNDATVPMKHWYSEAFVEAPLLDANGQPSGCIQISSPVEEWNGKYVPNGGNSREAWAAAFANDPTVYLNEVVCYVDESGELTFGVKSIGSHPNNANCTAFDNFKIEYLGADDLSGFKSTVTGLITRAEEILENSTLTGGVIEDPLTEAALPISVEAELTAAKEEANSKIIASDDYSIEEAEAVVAKLNAAIALSDSALVRSGLLVDEYALAIERTSTSTSEYTGYVDCMYAYEEVAYVGFESIDQINEWIVKFKTEFTNMSIYGKTEGASKDAPVELTDAIVNPGFEKTDALTGEVSYTSEGWDLSTSATAVNYSAIEFWQKNFDVSQDIYGLPSGYYRLEVNGFFRGSTSAQTAANYRDGVDTLFSTIYAEGAAVPYAVPVMSICEDATDAPTAGANINVGDSLYTGDDIENAPAKYIPNAMSDSRGAFDAGLYNNVLYFKIDEGQSKLSIGVRKTELRANDWTIFDNFRLYYYGDGEENMPDGVGEIVDGKAVVVTSTYYTIGGVQVAKPTQRGLYIREDMMSDGTKRTLKIMVR